MTPVSPWSDAMRDVLATLQRLAPQDRAAVLCEATQLDPLCLSRIQSLIQECYS